MIGPLEILEQVRQRAHYACEYCGVSEADTGGLLTLDHFRPKSLGGLDDLINLLYCCFRCNLYKAAYWAKSPFHVTLWNPRLEPSSKHFSQLDDGTLQPITEIGHVTIQRLGLNRPPLVSHRLRNKSAVDFLLLTAELKSITQGLVQAQQYQAFLLEKHHQFLEELRDLLEQLKKPDEQST